MAAHPGAVFVCNAGTGPSGWDAPGCGMLLAIASTMESVIADYQDLNTAEHAVRSLERRGMSIQNFSICDESRRVWRRSNPPWARPSRGQVARRGFLFGAALALIGVQLGLRLVNGVSGALPTALTWALVCGTCALGGCLGAAFTIRAASPRKATGFYVILRSDAVTIEAARAYLSKHQGA
jgi:hypothetical protein